MLGIEIGIDKPRVDPILFEDTTTIVMIGITGEVKGQVFLGFNKGVACKIVSSMIGFSVTEIDDMAESALSELCNMIMGNTATVFSEADVKIDITPPVAVKGSHVSFDTKGVEHILIPLRLNETDVVDMHVSLKK